MKHIILAAGLVLPAVPALPAEAPWVLIGLDIHMGAVTVRDTAVDADTVSVYGEGLPVYPTAAACQDALHHAIEKYAGRSHAEGNYGYFLCLDTRTLAHAREAIPTVPDASASAAGVTDAIATSNPGSKLDQPRAVPEHTQAGPDASAPPKRRRRIAFTGQTSTSIGHRN